MRTGFCFVLVMVPLLAGCVATPSIMPGAEPEFRLSTAHVVVGLVDSGINPYHTQFLDPAALLPSDIIDATTGERPIPLQLSSMGSYEERVVRDSEVWNQVESHRLYWFVGTRILAYSEAHRERTPLILDDNSHGTLVSSAVRSISEDAWIIMVQVHGSLLGGGSEPPVSTPLDQGAAGLNWLARQPWIDVVSSSFGFQVPVPQAWEYYNFTDASHSVVKSGKGLLNAAGNNPAPDWYEGTAGPPWVIAVGGVESSTLGDSPQASKGIDVVSDYTLRLAGSNSTFSFAFNSGTSFSAPRVAGVLAAALLQLRLQFHETVPPPGVLCHCGGLDVTESKLRGALNQSAVYWNTTDYNPGGYPNPDPVLKAYYTTLPILPTPWVQMGWGYVGNDTSRFIVANLQGTASSKPPEATAFMEQQQALREAYWSRNPATKEGPAIALGGILGERGLATPSAAPVPVHTSQR